jgi:dihydroorotase
MSTEVPEAAAAWSTASTVSAMPLLVFPVTIVAAAIMYRVRLPRASGPTAFEVLECFLHEQTGIERVRVVDEALKMFERHW